MATPSSKYAVDTTTTLANGTELKWTKQIKNIYPNLNDALDRSCTYSEMSSPVLSKSGYAFKQNMLTDQYTPAYGANGASSRWAKGFSRTNGWTKNIWYGSVLVDQTANSSNIRRYFFGYTDTSASIINISSAGNSRILRDIKVNKLLFSVTIKGYKVSDYNNIDYTANPFSSQAPSEVTIKLSELDANPNAYIVTSIFYNSTLVYGPNGANKWLSGSVYPTFICYSSDVGGFHWIPFALPIPTYTYSYQNQNGHPSWTGSAAGAFPVNLAYNYVFGCDNSTMSLTLQDTYAIIDQSLQGLALAQYGYDSNWNHDLFFNKKLHSFGDYRCIELQRGNVQHSGGNPGLTTTNMIQNNMMFGITGEAANKMIAGLGLYFVDGDEDFDPNDENITPDTMYQSQHIWLGEMSGHGITTGRWVKGSDIENYTGPNKNGVINDPDYDPGGGGGGSNDDDMDNQGLGATGSSGGFTQYYVMSPEDMSTFLTDFYTNAEPGETLANNLVCSYILGSGVSYWGATENIKITVHNSAQGTPFETQGTYSHVTATNNNIPLGSFTVDRMTNTFYDFAPYSSYEIFIPCCGWVSLPDTVAGRTIIVSLQIDIATCGAKGVVKFDDGATCAVCSGVLGSSIPLAVIESGLLRGANVQSASNTLGGALMAGAGFGNGNVGLGLNGISRVVDSFTQCAISGNTNFTNQKGSSGDITQFAMGHKCYLKITHPVVDKVVEETGFAHSVGYLCNVVGKLNTFKGFTICSNPHITGINATDAEKEEIKQLLESGVIL